MGTHIIVRTALFLYLLCTWYPFRWVIRLLWARDDDGAATDDDDHGGGGPRSMACRSVLRRCERSDVELLVQFAQDFVVFHAYFLYAAIVAATSSSSSSASTFAVNRLGLAFSMATLVWIVASHNYFHPTPTVQEYNATFFKESIVFYMIGAMILVLVPGRTGSASSFEPSKTTRQQHHRMKWSIPANAIFCGAVFELFIAFAALQWNAHRDTVASYLCIGSVVVRAILLLRVRYFMHLSALRWMCAFECVYQLLVRPDRLSSVIRTTDLLISPVGPAARFLRCSTAITYGLGNLWAGGAEAFGAILSSEKED